MRIALAIGGNALIRAGEAGTWEQQLANAREIAGEIVALHGAGHQLLLTHGNGPQVGVLMLQQALGEAEAPPLPLDALTAMTQGQVGYLLVTAIARLAPSLPTAVLLTRTLVDPHDPAFSTPTKPVGPFYDHDDAGRLAEERHWDMAPDAGRGWRRVVASPRPREVLGTDHVQTLLDAGTVVIAGGGGGIPVAPAQGGFDGVPGVIDKDRCTAELALAVGADLLVLLTGVPRVAIDFGTRWERELSRITVSEAVRGLAGGEFPAGSMGPKIESAERFVEAGRGRAVITAAGHVLAAVSGADGTWIVPDDEAVAV